jgi:membrane protease YdiL (CAAX protease family)
MEGEQRQETFWSYHDAVLFLCMALPCFAIGILFMKAVIRLVPGAHANVAIIGLTGQFLGYALWFSCLAALFHMRYGQRLWPAMNWRLPGGLVVPSFGLGVILALSVAVIGVLLRTPAQDNKLLELMNDRVSIMIVGFLAITFGPLCEELAFRGFLLPLLVRSAGAAAGIVLTALPFALLHGPQYNWSWQHMVLLTGVGCIFGWARYKTGSTGIPTLIHAGYNAAFIGALIISKREYF